MTPYMFADYQLVYLSTRLLKKIWNNDSQLQTQRIKDLFNEDADASS